MVGERLDEGWGAYFITFMFNQLRGNVRSINDQMQTQIEFVYASFLTRLYRRPKAFGLAHPILIACPDFPVPKHEKKPLREIVTNGGLHYHGVLLVPPQKSRLKVSVPQHFADNQSYYVREQILNRILVDQITHDVYRATDYTLKGMKTGRLQGNETLLILPKTRSEISVRPYRS